MQTKVKLYRQGYWQVIVIFEDSIPVEVRFSYRHSPFLSLSLDAIDWMVLGRLPDLQCVPESERIIFLNFLRHLLHQDLGGKCLLQISPSDIDLIKESVGLATTPVYPEDYAFFNNLMYLQEPKDFDARAENYILCQDKAELVLRAIEISRLLIDHAVWAGEDPLNRRSYGECAIIDRIIHQSVSVIAAINPVTKEIDGFVRIFHAGSLHYLGDLVVRTSSRGQGLAHRLMREAMQYIPKSEALLLIAGEAGLVKMYQKLGFVLLSQHHPLIVTDKVLVCGLIPRQTILEHYHQTFITPEAPL